MKTQGIMLTLDGQPFDDWTSGEVSLDLKDFTGAFTFTVRDTARSLDTFEYASIGAGYLTRPGAVVEIAIDGTLVLSGYVDDVEPSIDEGEASVTLSGRDKTGDLVDSAALVDGPAEFKNVKLEDAVSRVAAPFGLSVRSEIDTGEPFGRYSIDLSETAFSAVEKGARSRQAHILSDGIGGIVLTRTGKTRAPAPLTMPGNVRRVGGKFSHRNRHSETIVRGQSERAGKERTAEALITPDDTPKAPDDRAPGDGAATEKERKGTAATGRAKDEEITRYRPMVHLARSKADNVSAQEEAEWRMRTARGESEEYTYAVIGHSVDGRLWRVNELVSVTDYFLQVFRDMLITRVAFREDSEGRETELTVTSPEAFDKEPTGDRRTNAPSAKTTKALDTTAEKL